MSLPTRNTKFFICKNLKVLPYSLNQFLLIINFVNHHTEANHTYTNIDNKMDILHVHTKGRKLDIFEQLEIYKHTKTHKNDILNEQTHSKSNVLFEHITPYTHNIDPSKVTKNKMDSAPSGSL